jgi:hypothetical protein
MRAVQAGLEQQQTGDVCRPGEAGVTADTTVFVNGRAGGAVRRPGGTSGASGSAPVARLTPAALSVPVSRLRRRPQCPGR